MIMNKLKLSKYNIVTGNNGSYATLYNCSSGRAICLPSGCIDKIGDSEFQQKNLELVNLLKENGFLVAAGIDEYYMLRAKTRAVCEARNCEEIEFTIAPTLNCNMMCEYCFEKGVKKCEAEGFDKEKYVSLLIKFVENTIAQISGLKRLKISWFGGEPLLCYDVILEFSSRVKDVLKRYGVELVTRIVTNGALLSRDRIQNLVENCNLKYVQISLDGFGERYCKIRSVSKETYDKVIRNLAVLSDFVKVRVRLNATKENKEELYPFTKYLLDELGLKNKVELSFAQVRSYSSTQSDKYFNPGEFRRERRRFLDFLYDNQYVDKPSYELESYYPLACKYFPFYNVAIDPRGYLYKCEHHFGNSERIVGDVVNGYYYNKLHMNVYQQEDADERCYNCVLYPICAYSFCEDVRNYMGEKGCACYTAQLNSVINDVNYCIDKSSVLTFEEEKIVY